MIHRSALLFAIIAWTLTLSASGQKKPRPVEVWTGGDDGYTLRIRDAVEDAFRRSTEFKLSSGRRRGTLLVTIPENLKWKRRGDRTLLMYDVEFSTVGRKSVNRNSGSCWEDDLGACARAIMQGAARIP